MKKGLKAVIFAWVIGWMTLSTAYGEWSQRDHTRVQVLSDHQVVSGQLPFWVLVEFDIQPGWHTYWRNPGDSGAPPKFQWLLPEGWHASSIHWLPPKKIPAGPFVNYGYSDKAYHLVKITPKKTLSPGIVQIELKANWLVCEEECIPESDDLVLNLRTGAQDEQSEAYDRIHTLLAKTELPLLTGTASADGNQLFLSVNKRLPQKAYFYPNQSGLIEPAAKQVMSEHDKQTRFTLDRGPASITYPISGILQTSDANGEHYYMLQAQPKAMPQVSKGEVWLPMMLLFALVGGLILNLMPCVFPILSLKVLTLQASDQKKMQGIFYTLGVVISFLVIAAVMLLLQSLGSQVGWGFQLQSSGFVMSLIVIFTLIALNLFGWFEIPFSLSTNQQWRERHKLWYAFATGVLACVVATPCSAPFMATAVGVALTQNPVVALLIFMFLGIGLALPYLLIAFVPVLANRLPKPGAWMETAKQLLAFPMLLSVIWLLWVLGQQKSFNAVILVLLALTALAFFFWLRLRIKENLVRWIMSAFALGLVIWPLVVAFEIERVHDMPEPKAHVFSQAKLDALLAKKEKVFVYATAAWCITCKINEQVALNTQAVCHAFDQYHVKVLKADWTNKDETILKYLQKFGRAGVPLYVYYQPGHPPKVLPQLLTPATIINVIKGVS